MPDHTSPLAGNCPTCRGTMVILTDRPGATSPRPCPTCDPTGNRLMGKYVDTHRVRPISNLTLAALILLVSFAAGVSFWSAVLP